MKFSSLKPVAAFSGLFVAGVLIVDWMFFPDQTEGDRLSASSCVEFTHADMDKHRPHPDHVPSFFNQGIFDLTVSGLSPLNYRDSNVGHNPQHILGYFDKTSYETTEIARLFLAKGLHASPGHLVSIRIVNAETEEIETTLDISDQEIKLEYNYCYSFKFKGCDFEFSYELDMSKFGVGAYYAYISNADGKWSSPIFFNVKPSLDELDKYDAIILLADTTWHAYNYFGGGSFYQIHKDDDGRLVRGQNDPEWIYSVGFHRPMVHLFNDSGLFRVPGDRFQSCVERAGEDSLRQEQCTYWTRPTPVTNVVFGPTVAEAGYRHAYLGMLDLQDMETGTLPVGTTLFFTGHNEYFTPEMNKVLYDFVERGGNVLNFSGNINWWTIQIDDQTMYMDQRGGHRSDACNALIPRQFHGTGQTGIHLFPGMEKLFGVTYRFAGLAVPYVAPLPSDQREFYNVTDQVVAGYRGIEVLAPKHPIFKGTEISEDGYLVADRLLVGDEVDGLPILNGVVNPNYNLDLPHSYKLLGRALTTASFWISGVNGAYSRQLMEPAVIVEARPFESEVSGTVLSLGSIGVAYSLLRDDATAKRLIANGLAYLRLKPPAGDMITPGDQ